MRRKPRVPKLRLVTRRKMWTLTIQGWLLILGSAIALILLLFFGTYPFLAKNAPIANADALVVEGWLSDESLKLALDEFEHGSYQRIISTGTSITHGFYLAEYKNFAEISAATLVALGLDETKITSVPTPDVARNRTLAGAIAVRDWITTSAPEITSINVYSLGPHARRSWLLFRQAMPPSVQVGVVASDPLDYDPDRWWTSSSGTRILISEAIAYIYVRFVNWQS